LTPCALVAHFLRACIAVITVQLLLADANAILTSVLQGADVAVITGAAVFDRYLNALAGLRRPDKLDTWSKALRAFNKDVENQLRDSLLVSNIPQFRSDPGSIDVQTFIRRSIPAHSIRTVLMCGSPR